MRGSFRQQAMLSAFLGIFTIVTLIPVIWAFLTSIKKPVDAFTVPPTIFFTPTLEFHRQVWFEHGFWSFLVNSLIVAACTVAISVPLGTLGGYAFARIRTGHSRAVLFGLMTIRMFPHILLVIPFYLLARSLHLIDTYLVLILAFVALNQPFTIWLMRSFFVDLPHELDEAALIDGCNNWQAFYRVILPVARPGIAVTTLFSLQLAYNEFLFALVLTGSDTKTLPVAIASFGAEDISYWTLSAAGAIGISLPILIFVLLMQRHLIRGLTMGAIK
ncbi:MAG: carbohydrate ABC transporter permease [Nitratireductor sp.]|nr:carbohydrate ABC transporter permease [Nitratireductor sp.]